MAIFPQPSWLSSPKPSLFTSTPSKPSLFKTLKLSSSLNPPGAESPGAESSIPTSSNLPETSSEPEPGDTDPVKLAFARANAYKKKSIEPKPTIRTDQTPVQASESPAGVGEGVKEVPSSVKIALEKAKEYKKNKGVIGGSNKGKTSGLKIENGGNLGSGFVEKRVTKDNSTISSIDFMGLNFADKKEGRGLPAGLIPVADPFTEGDLPEVELILGDSSNFGDATRLEPKPSQEDSSDLYKPKVSTWGVFPRPGNISKTFGGGRVIRPGEVLEAAEEKAAKEKRTRKLLAAYKNKIGLNIDPKLKFECEKILKDGDSLMDVGKLKEALPYYEDVMNKLTFKSELHGLAALQWSICQDSLFRQNEARIMYEKLQFHPNVQVSKKARELMFSFQAMEMMKVTNTPLYSKNMGYQNYFEAFVKDKPNYVPLKETQVEEGGLSQAFPYILFLVSPILFVLFLAVQKGL